MLVYRKQGKKKKQKFVIAFLTTPLLYTDAMRLSFDPATFEATDIMKELVTLNGAISSDNCVNIRYNTVTASCRSVLLPTQSSGVGFRDSASLYCKSCTRKKSLLR